MERAAGFAHDEAAQAKLDKLDTLLSQSFTPRQDAALFGEMLSLTNDGRYPELDLPPQQRRQKTLEALTAQLETLSSTKPVLMIFEDAHWTDPTSMEALGRAVDRIRTLRLLLIVTYRPEFDPPWIGQSHVTALTLNRLGEREIAAMIDRLTGNKLLPMSIRQDIIERTDGIPLFAEEITKAALEAESEGAAERAIASVPSPSLAVPASLHASLMARLDRLGPAKEVAQIGAAIGREFSHALISAVSHTARGRAWIGAEPPPSSWLGFSTGAASPCDIPLQARFGARRSLWHSVARAAKIAACPYCGNARKPVSRSCGEPARVAGASLQRSWPDRKSCGIVGQGWATIAGPFGPSRSDRATHAGSRPYCSVAWDDSNAPRPD
jgi:hypothetical protein